MILGIHHVAVSVPDLQQAMGFYRDVLGFEEVMCGAYAGDDPAFDRTVGLNRAAAEMKMLRAGNAYIELWKFLDPAPSSRNADYPPSDHGIAHFCLQVHDIETEHARLSAAGMRFVGPPVDFGESSAVYGRDPFGNIIEIYEIRSPTIAQIAGPETSTGPALVD